MYHKISIPTLIWLVILFLTVFTVDEVSSQKYIGPLYGHYYYYNSGLFQTKNHSEAIKFCSTLTPPPSSPPNLKGYLATFTTEYEWEWVVKEIEKQGTPYNTSTFFDTVGTGVFSVDGSTHYYDSGPEIGSMMYNLSSDTCHTFCKFSQLAPAYMNQETFLSMKRSLTNINLMEMINEGGYRVLSFICEFSPDGTPGLQSISDVDFSIQGENKLFTSLRITNIPQDKILQSVTLSNIDTNEQSNCTGLELKQSNTYECRYFSIGRFAVSINTTDSFTYPDIFHQSNPPKPAYFSQTAISGGFYSIQIYGHGLINANVKFGLSGQVPCIIDNTSQSYIACKTTFINGFPLPLYISVANISYRSYTVGIYNPDTKLLYKLVSSQTEHSNVYEKASKFEIQGLNGYMTGFYNQVDGVTYYGGGLYSLIRSLNPTARVWLNCESMEANNKVIVGSGPFKDRLLEAYYNDTTTWPNFQNYPYYFVRMELSNGQVYRDPPSYLHGFVLEFGGYVPSFEDSIVNYNAIGDSVPFVLPTSGYQGNNTVGIKVRNARITNSEFKIKDTPVTLVEKSPFRYDIFFINIPSGFGGPFYLTYFGEGIRSLNTLSFYYNRPRLLSVVPNILPFYGSYIEIEGIDLSDSHLNIKVYLQGSNIQCTNIVMVVPHSKIGCTLPQGASTSYRLLVKVGNQDSTNFLDITYRGFPSVNGYSDVIQSGGMSSLTIYGERFIVNNGNLSVKVGGEDATDIKVIDETKVICKFNSDIVPQTPYDPLSIDLVFNTHVQSDALSINSPIFFYDSNLDCPNNCTGRGICNRNLAMCNCFTGYGSADCSVSVLPPEIRPVYDVFLGETSMTNDHVDIYTFRPFGIRLYDSNSSVVANISFHNHRFESYFGQMYSDINLQSQSPTSETYLSINFTMNSEPTSYAVQEMRPYAYSTNYYVKFHSFSANISRSEIIYLLQYSPSVQENQSDPDDPCGGQFLVETDNKQYYNLLNAETIFNSKFSQRVWQNDYKLIQKTSMTVFDTDPMVNPSTDVTNGYQYKVISQVIHNDNFETQVNFGIQKINNQCQNIALDKDNWKTPLIASVASVGAVVLVGISIFTYKSMKKHQQLKAIENSNVELNVRNINE
ncbi:DEAD/DEAH box helicase domain-containing protein [Tieghemostelium lacteum]|uniref:DEAD/DEAH box helicase domain-containing protein n=1 Tax=Tieghemostelium lacteum TaxID=361077 RepID=A0A152A2D7_TIELA|nr:DEAD/DEAH box helicase domain-containing protein [Tieghemostelium lacteum]|eukprot:KYR00413.1 DEAD/DEAH box helicase domain-containing protein [Tieghemostelium lacteum]